MFRQYLKSFEISPSTVHFAASLALTSASLHKLL
jgi:hypothetical protein